MMKQLLELCRTLRHPERGCRWDLAQDFQTFAPNVREEVEELMEAIREENPEKIREEIGDLLWNLTFLINLAEEAGGVQMQDVLGDIQEKMVRRHPHVFGGVDAGTPEEAIASFKKAKEKEKNKKN